jgi:hypothetical protein
MTAIAIGVMQNKIRCCYQAATGSTTRSALLGFLVCAPQTKNRRGPPWPFGLRGREAPHLAPYTKRVPKSCSVQGVRAGPHVHSGPQNLRLGSI